MLQKKKLQYSKAVVQYIDYIQRGENTPKGNYIMSYDDVFTEH
jgi:hypothetical protein